MPAGITKKSKAAEKVPGIGDPDRKRVLNVLAQRRYRQRRREKIAALEAQAQSVRSTESADQIYDVPVSLEPEEAEPTDELCPSLPVEDIGSIEEVSRTPPADDPLSLFDFDTDPFSLVLAEDFQAFPSLPTPLPSTPTTSSSSSSPSLNSPPPLPADSSLLPIPILAALNAFARIATTLNLTAHIWDPTYLHTLSPPPSCLALLPPNLHPIPAQRTIPHHPILDILPWPSVREKLICMLSMPSAFRPPVAQEDSETGPGGAIVQLVQDLDDLQDGGGVRVHGNSTSWGEGNELVEEAWEVGDVFYRRWWWCLDQRVLEASNRRRRERGLGRLRVVV